MLLVALPLLRLPLVDWCAAGGFLYLGNLFLWRSLWWRLLLFSLHEGLLLTVSLSRLFLLRLRLGLWFVGFFSFSCNFLNWFVAFLDNKSNQLQEEHFQMSRECLWVAGVHLYDTGQVVVNVLTSGVVLDLFFELNKEKLSHIWRQLQRVDQLVHVICYSLIFWMKITLFSFQDHS